MGLLQAVRSGVKTLHKVTLPLQSDIFFHRYTGQSGFAQKTYSPALNQTGTRLKAIVEDNQEQVRTFSGEISQPKTHITVVDAKSLSTATNGLGIHENDVIILANGETGPILSVSGFIDAGTHIPIATEVYLG